MMATLGSSTFQSTFSDALRVYKKRTKIDLLLHSLAVRLQPCDSPRAVISVLQEQTRAIDQSLTNLLHPTVNVIYALSSSLQEGVVVNFCACLSEHVLHFPFSVIIPRESHLCWLRCPLSRCFTGFPCTDLCHRFSSRKLRLLAPVRTGSSTFSDAWSRSFNDLSLSLGFHCLSL
jgi:hypothetical protein